MPQYVYCKVWEDSTRLIRTRSPEALERARSRARTGEKTKRCSDRKPLARALLHSLIFLETFAWPRTSFYYLEAIVQEHPEL